MTPAPAGRPAPAHGISAWTYGFDDARVRQILDHNLTAAPARRFRYLFPYAGSVELGREGRFTTSWKAEVAARYAAALPPDILLLPIFDGRQDEKQFNGWTPVQYEALARDVAAKVLADPHAAGIQVDIEPFHDDHLPFYEALGALLRAQGRLMTGFIAPTRPEATLRRMYAACDIVVLSGYDFEQPNPAAYGAALAHALERAHRIAVETAGHTLVGVPAAGSWAEHEYTGIVEGGTCRRQETGFTQPDWLRAALGAVALREQDDDFLGMALWVLSGRTEGAPRECRLGDQPDYIGPECWRLLQTAAP